MALLCDHGLAAWNRQIFRFPAGQKVDFFFAETLRNSGTQQLVPGLLFEPQRGGGVNSGVSNWWFYSHSSDDECLQLFFVLLFLFLFFLVKTKWAFFFAEVPPHVVVVVGVQTGYWQLQSMLCVNGVFNQTVIKLWLFFIFVCKWGSGQLSSPAASSHL